MRIVFDIAMIILAFFAPWWVTLAVGMIGALWFKWYLELIVIGVLYDVMFGAGIMIWYRHLIHTLWFAFPVFLIEIIRPRMNTYGFSLTQKTKK